MAIGTGALLVLIVVLVTGGFVIDAGPLHLSSHRWTAPFIGAFAAWLVAFLIGGREFGATAAEIQTFIDRHATALAIVIAASAAGVGVAYGTYSAAGSDASGYVSQAQLLASGRVARDEPLARDTSWPDATWVFSPLGYRPGQTIGEVVPTYPPGLPLTMAVALRSGAELAPFLVVPLLGAVAVVCTYALGARLHSRTAGVIASALLATSPIVLFQIVQPMSDVPAAAWWTLAMFLALSAHSTAPIAAGFVTGIAVLTRPNLTPLVLPVALAAAGWPSHMPRTTRTLRAVAFAAATLPAAAGLLWLQWRLYGNPFLSGYGAVEDLFLLSNVMPNIRGYAARLAAGEAPTLTLALLSLTILAITRHRAGLRALIGPALIASLMGAAVLVVYLPYGVFLEWSYLRFFLPALPCAFVLVAALLVQAAVTVPRPARGVMLLALVAAACSVNATVASREHRRSTSDATRRAIVLPGAISKRRFLLMRWSSPFSRAEAFAITPTHPSSAGTW